jgi:hypothetical protein
MTVSNINFLSQFGFRLVIARLPEIEYFLQRINLPGLNLPAATRATPFASPLAYPGDISFNDLTLSFKIDEDMKNYLSIWNWMVQLGFPQNFNQYKQIATRNTALQAFEEGEVTSNIRLIVLDNKHNWNYEIEFTSCWPTSLSDLNFGSTDPSVQYLTAEVTFKYHYYTITPNTEALPCQR